MQRAKFTTTLDTELIKFLKHQAIEENTDANQIIERLLRLEQTKGQTEMTAPYWPVPVSQTLLSIMSDPRLPAETMGWTAWSPFSDRKWIEQAIRQLARFVPDKAERLRSALDACDWQPCHGEKA